jgi:CubicO group peptidase (beta-lactamase class C family)
MAPTWARWTGDPLFDNYAHVEPGTQGIYASGGIWRLSQALTALWGRDLKQVLDDELFGHIGIGAEGWDWVPGKVVFDNKEFYPSMPGYGDFIDPPYEIDGHVIRGGGGWAIMSASDLARFGLLAATGGIWAGERLLDAEWVHSHGGGNGSRAEGDGETLLSLGMVTTQGAPSLAAFAELVTGPVKVSGG